MLQGSLNGDQSGTEITTLDNMSVSEIQRMLKTSIEQNRILEMQNRRLKMVSFEIFFPLLNVFCTASYRNVRKVVGGFGKKVV